MPRSIKQGVIMNSRLIKTSIKGDSTLPSPLERVVENPSHREDQINKKILGTDKSNDNNLAKSLGAAILAGGAGVAYRRLKKKANISRDTDEELSNTSRQEESNDEDEHARPSQTQQAPRKLFSPNNMESASPIEIKDPDLKAFHKGTSRLQKTTTPTK